MVLGKAGLHEHEKEGMVHSIDCNAGPFNSQYWLPTLDQKGPPKHGGNSPVCA